MAKSSVVMKSKGASIKYLFKSVIYATTLLYFLPHKKISICYFTSYYRWEQYHRPFVRAVQKLLDHKTCTVVR